eukprot:1140460-Pelagomonas_calceolata.AAC.3
MIARENTLFVLDMLRHAHFAALCCMRYAACGLRMLIPRWGPKQEPMPINPRNDHLSFQAASSTSEDEKADLAAALFHRSYMQIQAQLDRMAVPYLKEVVVEDGVCVTQASDLVLSLKVRLASISGMDSMNVMQYKRDSRQAGDPPIDRCCTGFYCLYVWHASAPFHLAWIYSVRSAMYVRVLAPMKAANLSM